MSLSSTHEETADNPTSSEKPLLEQVIKPIDGKMFDISNDISATTNNTSSNPTKLNKNKLQNYRMRTQTQKNFTTAQPKIADQPTNKRSTGNSSKTYQQTFPSSQSNEINQRGFLKNVTNFQKPQRNYQPSNYGRKSYTSNFPKTNASQYHGPIKYYKNPNAHDRAYGNPGNTTFQINASFTTGQCYQQGNSRGYNKKGPQNLQKYETNMKKRYVPPRMTAKNVNVKQEDAGINSPITGTTSEIQAAENLQANTGNQQTCPVDGNNAMVLPAVGATNTDQYIATLQGLHDYFMMQYLLGTQNILTPSISAQSLSTHSEAIVTETIPNTIEEFQPQTVIIGDDTSSRKAFDAANSTMDQQIPIPTRRLEDLSFYSSVNSSDTSSNSLPSELDDCVQEALSSTMISSKNVATTSTTKLSINPMQPGRNIHPNSPFHRKMCKIPSPFSENITKIINKSAASIADTTTGSMFQKTATSGYLTDINISSSTTNQLQDSTIGNSKNLLGSKNDDSLLDQSIPMDQPTNNTKKKTSTPEKSKNFKKITRKNQDGVSNKNLKRAYGEFYCRNCDRSWASNNVWVISGTRNVYIKRTCNQCHNIIEPWFIDSNSAQKFPVSKTTT